VPGSSLLDLLVILFSAGGVAGGLVALVKARPEAARTMVGAAEGAVLVQNGVIQSLRDEVTRIALDNERCRKREWEMEAQVMALERRVLDLGGTL